MVLFDRCTNDSKSWRPAYKPNSVSRSFGMMAIHLVPVSQPGSSDLPVPPSSGKRTLADHWPGLPSPAIGPRTGPGRDCSVLLPAGFASSPARTEDWWSLTPPFHLCSPAMRRGGRLVSVALSVTPTRFPPAGGTPPGPPPVRRRRILRSSDFPPPIPVCHSRKVPEGIPPGNPSGRHMERGAAIRPVSTG